MILPATTAEFLNQLKTHFAFPGPDRDHPFISRPDIFLTPTGAFVNIPDRKDPYAVHVSEGPYTICLVECRGGFSINVAVEQTRDYLSCVPVSGIPVSTLHRHAHLEFVCILEGSLDFMIEGVHKRYQKGDIFLLTPMVRFVEEIHTDYTALYLHMDGDYLKNLLDTKQGAGKSKEKAPLPANNWKQLPVCFEFAPLSRETSAASWDMDQLLFQIVLEFLYKQPRYQDIIDNLMCRMFSYLRSPALFSCSQMQFENTPQQSAVEQILLYLHAHPYNLKREEIAAAVGYSANYTNRIFLEHTGQSLADYNREIYLKEAADLLLNTDLSIGEICEKLRFEGRSAFYAQFQKKYGVTPGEYRTGV